MIRTTQISVLLVNTSLQSHLSIACSIATNDELVSPSKTMKVIVTNNTDRTFARVATIRPSNNVELIFSSKTTIGILVNNSEWAFMASMMPTNDSG